MSKINFSKAPDGATHYRSGVADTTLWYKKDPSINPLGYHWVWWCKAISEWSSCGGCSIEAAKMHKQQTVTCNNEREAMLCEEVIRRCRGEDSEWAYKDRPEWKPVDKHIVINDVVVYRAKPKKELVVPWEWLPNRVTSVTVHQDTSIRDNDGNALIIKLDLTDIELPVTVERPTC